MIGSQKMHVSGANHHSMIVLPFSVSVNSGELRMFLNIQKIARVVDTTNLAPLPRDMKPFCGVFNMDGIPIPVLDLRTYFEKHPQVSEESGLTTSTSEARIPKHSDSSYRMIICNTMDVHIGIIVDRTRKVETVQNSEIMVPPAFLAESVFCAVVKEKLGFSYLLDIESLLEKEGVNMVKNASFEHGDTSSLKGKRILFIDDSKYFRSLGKKLLEKFNIEVDTAADGKEGLNQYMNNTSAYDLILTDIEMPIMSGIEMAKTIRKHDSRNIPIVFHSSISNAALIADLKNDNIGDYIVKFDEKSIVEIVLKYMAA